MAARLRRRAGGRPNRAESYPGRRQYRLPRGGVLEPVVATRSLCVKTVIPSLPRNRIGTDSGVRFTYLQGFSLAREPEFVEDC